MKTFIKLIYVKSKYTLQVPPNSVFGPNISDDFKLIKYTAQATIAGGQGGSVQSSGASEPTMTVSTADATPINVRNRRTDKERA
jgi:hypothetical protein